MSGPALLTIALYAAAGGPGRSPDLFDRVGVTEQLGAKLPLDVWFIEASGATTHFGRLIQGGKPVILVPVYYRCPMLCGLMLTGLTQSLKQTGLKLGEDYRAIALSIDPSEGADLAAEKKRGHLQSIGESPTDPGWAFLVGGPQAIESVARAIGFHYAYDAEGRQFAHVAVAVVLTPEGKVSRYLYGLSIDPKALRLSLVEASDGKVGTAFDRALLTCYRYDPASRKYAWMLKGILQGGGLLVFTALAGLLGVLWARELGRKEGPSPK